MPKQPPTPLLFDANAPTLKNNHEPIKAQIASTKHKSRNPESIKTIKRHLPNYFSVDAFIGGFLLFALNKKNFDPHPPAHIYQSAMVNSSWYEYHLIDLLQATRQPAENLLAKMRQSYGYLAVEKANQWYNAKQEIDKLYQLYSSTDDDPNHPNKLLADSLVKAVFGYSNFWADYHKRFVRQSVVLYVNVFDQIETITRYLELLNTLPEYEHLPEAQRDEQLRVIFSDYLNIK